MKIALDYDETFTAAPVLWKQFIALCKEYGHEVKFVTNRDGRFDNDDILADASDCGIPIIFTNGLQKEHVYKADVWIDDSPETIVGFRKLGDQYDGCLIMNDVGDKK